MPLIRVRWSDLLRIPELSFIPDFPSQLNVSDNLQFTLSLLTGATKHDRRLLRCDENGCLLVANPWDNLNSVETDELHPDDGSPDTYTASVDNKGVLIATSDELVKITIKRVNGGAEESFYVPPYNVNWFGHTVYSVKATCVPASGGSASYVGITAYN